MNLSKIFCAGLLVFSAGSAAAGDKVEAAIGGAAGGAVGAIVGDEIGDRKGAIIGAAVGAAVGTAIATEGNSDKRDHGDRQVEHHGDHHDGYVHVQRVDYGHGHSRHCPPGQAKKGRC
jgi:outer membrane lipoprotein SlyB